MVDVDVMDIDHAEIDPEIETESEEETEEVNTFVQIARELAGNTLKDREIAYKKLIRSLFDNETAIERVDGLRMWKGLFFMLWHSDGLEVQETLCQRMADLLLKFKLVKNRWTYLQTAIEILNREWIGIDRLRLSKYMLLCRFMLRNAFILLGKEGWVEADVNWFLGVMSVGPLQYHQPIGKQGAPLGVRYHFADMWTEELIRVGGSKSEYPLTEEQTLPFVTCWCKVATLTSIGIFRNKINTMIFDDLIERSDISIEVLKKHAKENDKLNDRIEDMEEAGSLKINFEAVIKFILELIESDGENVKMKQRKAMYRIIKKFKSVAEGEVPMDDITDWAIDNDKIDKFLYHTQHGFSKKELKAWDGLKSTKTMTNDITKSLEDFLGHDTPTDPRVKIKIVKKKSKKRKAQEKAQRKKKMLKEVLFNEKKEAAEEAFEITQPDVPQEPSLKRKRMMKKSKALSILTDDVEMKADERTPDNGTQVEEEVVIVPKRKIPELKKITENEKLAALAQTIRSNIDNESKEPSKTALKKKKKMKGDEFQFAKISENPITPTGTAFVSHAQRKLMKKQKKPKVVSKAAEKMYQKESKLKFNEQLCEFKPFKKLDKPEVVGLHPGELNIHDPSITPRKSALKVKSTPRKIVGNKGKIKWQG